MLIIYKNILIQILNIYEEFNKIMIIRPNEYQLKEDFGKSFNYFMFNNVIKEKVVISNKSQEHFLNSINSNKMTNDTLLVLMTCEPEKINYIYEVLISLLYQSANISSYQCFLSLTKEDFNNGEKDLPRKIQKLIINGWIKIIWNQKIYSNIRLMPIIKKYPANDILIVNNNIIRTHNFIEIV